MRTASLSCIASRIVLARASMERACIVSLSTPPRMRAAAVVVSSTELPLQLREARLDQGSRFRPEAALQLLALGGMVVAFGLQRRFVDGRQLLGNGSFRLGDRLGNQARRVGDGRSVEVTGSGFAAGAGVAGRWARLPKSGRRSASANADMA